MAHDESKTVSHRHRGDGDYNRITFRSLKELNLSAPLELIQGFLVYPEPPLANLVLNSAAWPENHYYGGYPSSFQLYLPDSVRNIHLTLGPDTHQSWRYPQNIESLHIHGGRRYSINGLNRYLDSLDVRSANVTLGDLAALLKSAPFLKDIALPFPICYPPDKPTYLPHHPLKKLTILKPVDSRSESGHTIVRIASPEPTPMPLTEVARFLDLLAPSLETLTAEGGDKTWDSIFRIIKLCQEVRSVNETGVEARACIF
ncbi:hypothetical protein P691DRAFT_761620 [Macrolepiota fuliginosa MF-IS2]|uniref:Uncharacterized protein n=1 Tax=Macrolepiota fuliginosa MF-IS2 TaxID=1400762 RepID=A0A9P6C0D3_9AGAR|nr:hypothetical protein P691DRAFT_761620 [Macrolepiota fuliginosa MF-IS2]